MSPDSISHQSDWRPRFPKFKSPSLCPLLPLGPLPSPPQKKFQPLIVLPSSMNTNLALLGQKNAGTQEGTRDQASAFQGLSDHQGREECGHHS